MVSSESLVVVVMVVVSLLVEAVGWEVEAEADAARLR